MTNTENSEARFVNFIPGEKQINPEEPNTVLSWSWFIGALLLTPLFIGAILFFFLADKIKSTSAGGIKF